MATQSVLSNQQSAIPQPVQSGQQQYAGPMSYPQNVVQAQPVYQQPVPVYQGAYGPPPVGAQPQYRQPAPSRPPVRDVSTVKCFNCDNYGHYATTCLEPKRSRRRFEPAAPAVSAEETARNTENARMADLYRKHQREEEARGQREALEFEKREKIQREQAFFTGIDHKFEQMVSVFHQAAKPPPQENMPQNIPKVKLPDPIMPILRVSPSSDTAVRDLFVLWLDLQVAGGVKSVREQILGKKWAKSDSNVMRLYKWIIKMGVVLEPSKDVNPHQAVENLANFFTE
eukprot:252012_1